MDARQRPRDRRQPDHLGRIAVRDTAAPARTTPHRLQKWFAGGVEKLHVLELDAETASVWAILLAELKRKGRAMPVKDSLIAATARQHDLTVVTRNIGDFRHAGVAALNPFVA